MRRVNRGGVFLALLAAVFAVALCAAPAQAQAATQITLNPEGGSCSPTSVQLNSDGTLPSLPTPSKANFTFEGWCTAPVTYVQWGSFSEPWGQKVPAPVQFHPDGHAYTYESDYWTYLASSTGHIVHAGDALPADVTQLYACYRGVSYTVVFNWNGWAGKVTSMSATRAYGMATSAAPLETWAGHTFLGWYTDPKSGQGEVFSTSQPVTKNLTVYAHYTGMADDPQTEHKEQVASRIEAWDVKLSPKSAKIKPKGGSVTLTAELKMDNSVVNPTSQDWGNVHWSVSVTKGSGNLVSLSNTTGSSCTVKGLDHGSGEVEVTASFTKANGRKVTSVPVVITLDAMEEHVHSYNTEKVTVAPTCQKEGRGVKTCSCGATQTVVYPKADHTYKTITEAATCTKTGSEKTVCTVCGHEGSTKTLPKTGHDFEVKTLKETCVGTAMQKTCKNCGFIETYESGTAGKNHSWSDEWTVDKQPTCGTPGSKSHHCTACGMTKDSTEIPATGNHVFGGWHTTKVATADAKGEQERMCEICHAVETKELPALVGGESESTVPDDHENAPDESQKDDSQEDSEGTTDTGSEETTGDNSEGTTGGDSETNPGTTDPNQQPSGQQPTEVDKDTSNVRVFNPNNGEHLYVKSGEAADLEARGWTVEQSHVTATYSSTPVYRLYNPWSGEHHYTTSLNEVNTLKGFGWTVDFDGKPAFYSDDDQAVKVYRLWNGQQGAGSHHYTTSIDEYNDCIARGWQDEGTGWYYVA